MLLREVLAYTLLLLMFSVLASAYLYATREHRAHARARRQRERARRAARL